MRTIFIETRKKFNSSEINFSILDKLPGNKISLAATVQYLDIIPQIKKYLESIGKKVFLKKGAKYLGHVLGCNSSALDLSADTFLLITDGKFHGINNAIQLNKEIYIFDTRNLEKIDKGILEDYRKKIIGKKKKFLLSDTIGLIQSSKPGQKNTAINTIKEKIEKLNKEVFVFECDNIDTKEFENFPQIKIWVNTACFGLARDDTRIINLTDILEYIN